jgi:hypothetical protein
MAYRTWKNLLDACTLETPSGTLRIAMATLVPMLVPRSSLNCTYNSAGSMPVICTANLIAIEGRGGGAGVLYVLFHRQYCHSSWERVKE